jgi:ABC-type siderophore export system fused ATPase/permease subunit
MKVTLKEYQFESLEKIHLFKIIQKMQGKLKVIGIALMQKRTISKGIMLNTCSHEKLKFLYVDILIMVNINSLPSEL